MAIEYLPMGYELGFKPGSQVNKIYTILRLAYYAAGKPGVETSTILRAVPTTNHRRCMCQIREALEKWYWKKRRKNVDTERFIVPPAHVEKNKSWYWLERSN